jgi:lipoyl-dependent peroxiredoxin
MERKATSAWQGGSDRAKFEPGAEKAKTGCPMSKVLRAEISMDARLVD